MSTYCNLVCVDCREALFVKDADSDVHCDKNTLGQFLEKHCEHTLKFLWEEDFIKIEGKWICPDGAWPQFKVPPPPDYWSKGSIQRYST